MCVCVCAVCMPCECACACVCVYIHVYLGVVMPTSISYTCGSLVRGIELTLQSSSLSFPEELQENA